MKKIQLIALVLAAVAGLAFAGVAYAQGTQPPQAPYRPGMMGGFGGGYGPLHTYVVEAFAAKLGLTVDEVNAHLAAGETIYQIALAEGIAEADISALLTVVHQTALSQAVTDGVITHEQADWMQSHAFGRGGYGQGMGLGQELGAGQGACGGTGVPGGTGMQRGGRWAQQNP